MKKILSVITAVCLLLGCTGCAVVSFGPNGKGMVEGKGDVVSVDYPVGEFTKLDVRNRMRVVYSAQASNQVTVKLQENLAEYLNVNVENGVLIVDFDTGIRVGDDSRLPTLHVSTPNLEEIRASGAIDFGSGDPIEGDSFVLQVSGAGGGELALNVKNLDVSVSGAGGLTLSGTADTARLSISGVGSVDALELQTKNAIAELSGAGTVSVSCSETLSASIGGTGSIEYRGNPQVSKSVSGMGNISQVE